MLVGGCLQVPADQPAPQGTPNGDALPRFTLSLEGCTGFVAAAEVPRDAVQLLLPTAFDARGLTAVTATLLLEDLHCARVALPGLVFLEVDFFQVLARVAPANASWAENQASRFVLGFVVGSADLEEEIRNASLPAEVGTISRTDLEPISGPHVRFLEIHTGDVHLITQFAVMESTTPSQNIHVRHWAPFQDKFLRVDVSKVFGFDTPAPLPGLLRVTGTAPWTAALPASCCVDWTGQAYASSNETWSLHPSPFK